MHLFGRARPPESSFYLHYTLHSFKVGASNAIMNFDKGLLHAETGAMVKRCFSSLKALSCSICHWKDTPFRSRIQKKTAYSNGKTNEALELFDVYWGWPSSDSLDLVRVSFDAI